MDAFYAAIEQLDDPALRGRPVLVGSPTGRGVVLTASYEARPFGVGSAMAMAKARRLCPQAVIIPPRFDRYQETSRTIMKVFSDFSPDVEALSLDEAFLDMTGSENIFGGPESIGRRIKDAVREATGGLRASVGLSGTKYVAKAASAYRKPDGLTVVPPEEAKAWLAPLPYRGCGVLVQRIKHDFTTSAYTPLGMWLLLMRNSSTTNSVRLAFTSTPWLKPRIPGQSVGGDNLRALAPNIRSRRTCVRKAISNATFIDQPTLSADA